MINFLHRLQHNAERFVRRFAKQKTVVVILFIIMILVLIIFAVDTINYRGSRMIE